MRYRTTVKKYVDIYVELVVTCCNCSATFSKNYIMEAEVQTYKVC